MLPDRLRHSPALVLLPPIFLFLTGLANAALSGVELMPSVLLFGALAIAVAILLGTIAGPFAVIVFCLTLICALITLLPTVFEVMFGINSGISVLLGLALIAAIGYGATRLRSPFRHRFNGEVFINRPRKVVWDALYMQATNNHWKPHVSKVEAVPGQADHFNVYYQDGSKQVGDVVPPPTMIRRSNVTEGKSFTVETAEAPDIRMLDGATDQQTFVFEDDGMGTRVTTVEYLDNARLDLLVLSSLIKPCQDELRQLKLILEGSDDTTFASAFYRDEE